MKTIEIDKMSETDLCELGQKISKRLELFQQAREDKALRAFSIGERVMFKNGLEPITGIVTRYNQKTLTVLTPHGEHWNVSPVLLKKLGKDSLSTQDRVLAPTPMVSRGKLVSSAVAKM